MSALSDAVVAELARRYSPQTKRNPAWDRKAERAAWDRDEEYEVPEQIPRTAEEMAGDTCHHVRPGADGYMSIYTLTYRQIAEVVEAVEAARADSPQG
ncbi:hypothetical protein [Kineosporia babensis]|uniref:Uncharacterized protein n=1 Tax=Kineosporia babensis TaxID=499548 RepID=A0A9X1N9J9_9ACTN|nr:hypothetical protein [Kineosporia babensis]MCD5310882.1 hypothetical protein [Kineosporia babensis]